MSSERPKGCFLVTANIDELPCEVPVWLIRLVVLLNEARHSILEAESSASVIAALDGDPREKCQRIGNVLLGFVEKHGERMKSATMQFARLRQTMPDEIAESIGTELSVLLLVGSNMKFRGGVLRDIGQNQAEWSSAESLMLSLLAESCKGQQHLFDFLQAKVFRTNRSEDPAA